MDDSKEVNVLSAHAALLDYYGDRSVSFASLFLASIFGLVASSAIIQGLTNSIGNLKNPIVDWAVIAISLFVFLLFAYMGVYNYRRWTFWTSMAQKMMESHLYRTAELTKYRTSLSIEKKNKKAHELLKESAKCKKDILEPQTSEDEKHDCYKVSMETYFEYMRRVSEESFFKKVIAPKFGVGYFVLVISLALLSYYPLLQKLPLFLMF